MQQQPEPSVSMDNAWRAAVERAKRGTEALIVVEAQVLEVLQRCDRLEEENASLRRELEDLREQPKEVNNGRAYCEATAAAVGEADPPPPFSD